MKTYGAPDIPEGLLAAGGLVVMGLMAAFTGWMVGQVISSLQERWKVAK